MWKSKPKQNEGSAPPGGIVTGQKGNNMEKVYEVTFTHRGQKYKTEVEAACKHDAIEQAKEIGFGEDWEAVLISVDGVPVNGLKG